MSEPIKSIIDIGCGNGEYLDYFKSLFNCSATGVEVDEKVRHRLEKRYPRSHFIKGDNQFIYPFGDQSFDIVMGYGMFEYVDRHELLKAVGEAVRLTNKYLVILNFSPSKPFKVRNKHQPDSFVYRQDISSIVKGLKIFSVAYSGLFVYQDGKFKKSIRRYSEIFNFNVWKLTIFKREDLILEKKDLTQL
jgi:SAM-dependent methyltransferase